MSDEGYRGIKSIAPQSDMKPGSIPIILVGVVEVDNSVLVYLIGKHSCVLFTAAQLVVMYSFSSWFRAERDMVLGPIGLGGVGEGFVDAPVEAYMERDPNRLYAKMRITSLISFNCVNATSESPSELHIETVCGSASDCTATTTDCIVGHRYIA